MWISCVERFGCAACSVHCGDLWSVGSSALWRDVQLAEETSYGVQTVLAHATTLEDDDNDDGDEDDALDVDLYEGQFCECY